MGLSTHLTWRAIARDVASLRRTPVTLESASGDWCRLASDFIPPTAKFRTSPTFERPWASGRVREQKMELAARGGNVAVPIVVLSRWRESWP
jgi:hypothetical protein